MPEINYQSIFDSLDTFTGLPITNHRGKWYGKCRFDGTPHRRRDKLCAYMKNGKVRIIEQGEQSLSVWDWLLSFGDCNSNKEVRERLLAEGNGVVTKRYEPEIKRSRYISEQTVVDSLGIYSDTLFSWLCTMFPEQDVINAYDLYNVGSDGLKTVFWYKNFIGKYCFDKVMTYKNDGHRDKGRVPSRKFMVRDGYTDRCFFGEHLLDDWRKENFVVESEKTALILYLYSGRKTIATGGSSCLASTGKGSILLPDYDKAGETWSEWGKTSEWWKRFKNVQEGDDIGDSIVAKKKQS